VLQPLSQIVDTLVTIWSHAPKTKQMNAFASNGVRGIGTRVKHVGIQNLGGDQPEYWIPQLSLSYPLQLHWFNQSSRQPSDGSGKSGMATAHTGEDSRQWRCRQQRGALQRDVGRDRRRARGRADWPDLQARIEVEGPWPEAQACRSHLVDDVGHVIDGRTGRDAGDPGWTSGNSRVVHAPPGTDAS